MFRRAHRTKPEFVFTAAQMLRHGRLRPTLLVRRTVGARTTTTTTTVLADEEKGRAAPAA